MSQRNRDRHTESLRKLKGRQGEKQGGRKIRREQERMIVWEREREKIERVKKDEKETKLVYKWGA